MRAQFRELLRLSGIRGAKGEKPRDKVCESPSFLREEEMDPFQKVSLGKSNLMVTRLGLGGGPLAGLFTDVPEAQSIATVQRAIAAGVKLFDTAPMYGLGKSETR